MCQAMAMERKLVAHCAACLGKKAPLRIFVVPALPRNTMGKVVKRDLARIASEWVS
jgi:acyl-coenzyme A synthetase/AMP-(fatty) acid ligase